ncbi:MAG TPA: glycosyltransferase, partial [Stellaceae bacterium]|nr:glycosyltransferase [Stellaceae bacterium]
MNYLFLFLATLSLLIWIYLLLGRGFFWVARLPRPAPSPSRWPSVVAVVPARNEADFIRHSLGSLLAQDYPGRFSVVLVDDHSTDGTAEEAQGLDGRGRLTILGARPLPPGWSGKLWAL